MYVVFGIAFIIIAEIIQLTALSEVTLKISPKLNISSTILDVSLNTFLYIQCSGQYPLSWGFINPMEKEYGYLDINAKRAEQTSNGSMLRFESTITLELTSFVQTGKYVCYYNISILSRTASVYVFVNDIVHLLLPSDQPLLWMDLHPSQSVNIPCHPTISSANISLWKTSNIEEMVAPNKILLYDPTEGFTLIFPSSYFDGAFYCKATYESFEERLEFYFDFVRETQVIPRVYIDNSKAEYVLVNSNFSLTCIVRVEMGTNYFRTWAYPMEDVERICIGKEKKNEDPFDYIYQETSETLQVSFAQKSDEGIYQCNVTDHSGKANYFEVHVNIYEDPQQTTVEFQSNIDLSNSIIMTRGENLELKASYKAFPYSPDISLLWTKDGGQILQKIDKYLIQQTDSECVLTVFNLTRYDTGVYILAAHASGGMSNISFRVEVQDAPLINIENATSCCYAVGRNYQLVCSSEALPQPDVSWSWKPHCIENVECENNNTWQILEKGSLANNATIISKMTQGKSRKVILLLQATAIESGYYKCSSKNDLGVAEQPVPFIVTDIKNGFEVVSSEFPLEMEPFVMTCKATSLFFSSLQWSWRSIQENQSFHVIEQNLKELKSFNSITLQLKYDALMKNQSGMYSCAASLRFENSTKIESISIVVKEKMEPGLIYTNLNVTSLTLSVNSMLELMCYVDGTPYPIITWFHNGKIFVANTSGVRFEDDFQKLIISRLVKEDSGIYECRAQNVAGIVSRNITLLVPTDDMLASSRTKESDPNQIAVFIIVGVGAVSTATLVSLVSRWIYRKKRTRKKFQYFNHKLFQEGQMSLFNPDMALEDQSELLPYDERWEFPKDRLKLGRTLGQGAFGRVVKAEAIGLNDSETSTTVAVKMLKERADPNQQKALLAELKILIHLGHHVNIVNLLGAVTKNILRGELMVIVEYCRYGNLRHYLLRHRENFTNQIDPCTGCINYSLESCTTGKRESFSFEVAEMSYKSNSPLFAVENPSYRQKTEDNEIISLQGLTKATDGRSKSFATGYSASCSSGSGNASRQYYRIDSQEHKVSTCDLLCYAFQCARGMEYLASRKLIHRDLAARNVLLAEEKVVKICDFGLAKDCYKYLNYVKKGDGPLPIKWMAIESIGDKVFTTKSDVWSFGILMWEFFTLGSNPYPGIEVDEEFYRRLKIGYRMEKPEYCPNEAFQIMQKCWKADPNQRPEFIHISEEIGELLESGVKQHYVDLNDPYLEMNQETLMHDYLNVSTATGNSEIQTYVNSSDITCEINSYGNIPSIRNMSENLASKEDIQTAPMIRLESISEDVKNETCNFVSVVEHEKSLHNLNDTSCYLHMGNTCDVSFTTQEDSVFY